MNQLITLTNNEMHPTIVLKNESIFRIAFRYLLPTLLARMVGWDSSPPSHDAQRYFGRRQPLNAILCPSHRSIQHVRRRRSGIQPDGGHEDRKSEVCGQLLRGLEFLEIHADGLAGSRQLRVR